MKYISTRGQAPELTFEEAMLTGLARDGGLYVPAEWPELSTEHISGFAGKSYADVAFEVMKPFVGDTFTDSEWTEDLDGGTGTLKSHKSKRRRSTKPPTKKGLSGPK